MAPAASVEEEQDEVEREMPQQQESPAPIKEALEKLETINGRISELLKAYGHRGGVKNDAERRSLSFVEMEVSAAIASLNQPALWNYGADDEMKSWLHKLVYRAECIELSQYDPSRHRLMRKAAQCFRPPRRPRYRHHAIMFHSTAENPSRYRHLSLGQPPTEASDERVEAAEFSRQLIEAESGGLHLVGMDSTMKKLLKWLATADQRVRVLSIVGPVGFGKTTLAVELYRRLRCQTRGRPSLFNSQCYAVAQMSRGPDRYVLLLRQILLQIHGSAAPEMSTGHSQNDLELLVRDIREHLQQDKRYLILIDDIWEVSDWEEIMGAFPDNKCGSRILITTRVTSVAYEGCSCYHHGLVHEMKPLNQVDSEKLLLTRASGSVDACLPDDLDEILSRCEGVPLFITGTADWLKEQKQENNSAFHSGEQVCQIPKQFEQALFRAYNDLPYKLRLLSLYLSMFPHGYMFDKDRLVTKWLREGLAWSPRKWIFQWAIRAEELFSALVDRNIITRVVASNPDEAGAYLWQVSHYMRQFLASISTKKGFAFTGTTPTSATAPEAWPRRVALHHPDPELTRLLQTVDFSQTRSLAVSGAVDQIPFGRFLYLVVLDLDGWDNLKDDDLLHICRNKMYFLRYLSIRKTQVTKLPSEISELVNLEILDASHTQISELPSQVFELRYLRELDLRGTLIREIPEQIGRLHSLRRLLVGGDGMINSVQTATRIPDDISRVRDLETLATVDLSEHPASFLNSLGTERRLRVLAITWSFHQCIDDAYCKALVSSIQKWEELESLTIHCGLGCSMEFLASLPNLTPNLHKVKVTAGRFVCVPRWINGLRTLSFVQITVCKLGTDDLMIFGHLLRLRCLILGLEFIPREAIVIESGAFFCLERFFVDCPVPWLSFRTGAMSKLTYLQLKICSGPPSQESVPSGICNLQNLREIVLSYSKWCANSSSIKMTVEAVKKEVAKHRNPIDLFINGTIVDVEQVDEEMEGATEVQSEVEAEAKDDVRPIGEEARRITSEIEEIEDHNETGP